MKKKSILLTTLFITLFLISCSSDDSVSNKEPTAFTLIGPEGTSTDVIPEFNWNASNNTDGETISYTLFGDTNANPITIIADNITTTSFTPTEAFAHNETYNWRVEATNTSGNTTNSNTLSFTTKSLNVYVAGYSGNNSSARAVVWKNGIETPLTDGDRKSETQSIFVVNEDVYVAGYEYNAEFTEVAKVWKNGVATILTDGSTRAFARSVFVSENDVYVAGSEVIINSIAKIWKNGVSSILSNDGDANAVFVAGNDVYVAGSTSQGQTSTATVWKNGIATELTNGNTLARLSSVFVVGSDVYTAGRERSSSNNSVAKVWKNGVVTLLTDGGEVAVAASIFVAGTDVYVSGYEDNAVGTFTARIWKNGAVILDEDVIGSVVNSVFVVDNDVYAVGRLGGSATMWKNGVATTLNDGDSSATAIYIVEQ